MSTPRSTSDQRQRHGDRQVRHEVAVRRRGPIEPSARIAKTNVATKRPERDLRARSRMKLRSIRGPNWVEASVSGDDRDREDDADDRDHRRGDRGQDLAGRVGGAAVHPRRQRELAVVRRLVDRVRAPRTGRRRRPPRPSGTSQRFVRSASRRQSDPSPIRRTRRTCRACDGGGTWASTALVPTSLPGSPRQSVPVHLGTDGERDSARVSDRGR